MRASTTVPVASSVFDSYVGRCNALVCVYICACVGSLLLLRALVVRRMSTAPFARFRICAVRIRRNETATNSDSPRTRRSQSRSHEHAPMRGGACADIGGDTQGRMVAATLCIHHSYHTITSRACQAAVCARASSASTQHRNHTAGDMCLINVRCLYCFECCRRRSIMRC
jgi:hypothetical protein